MSISDGGSPIMHALLRMSAYRRPDATDRDRLGLDTRGNVAILFALLLVPVAGLAGAALDYSRAHSLRSEMRVLADSTAIAIAMANDPQRTAMLQEQARQAVLARHDGRVENVTVTGEWVDEMHYRIRIEADLFATLSAAMPGMSRSLTAGVETVVRRPPMVQVMPPPDFQQLNHEAADYNRVYSYCFNPDRAGEDDNGRRNFVPLADNATPPTVYDQGFATCGPGEYISFKLRNVRSARSNPEQWDDPSRRVHIYYADATINPVTGVLEHDFSGYRLRNGWRYEEMDLVKRNLETVVCPTLELCVREDEGGILPNYETHRDPEIADEPCEPGMYMYYAWEDRSQGYGWTDYDFNDIRLVIGCPTFEEAGGGLIRVVR